MAPMLSLLADPLIRTRETDGSRVLHSLPSLFVALAADQVQDFPALRPHQRHAWHALLVQLAALARVDQARTPSTEREWRDALRALTPGDDGDASWSLVTSPEHPAFLQPPAPDGQTANWKGMAATPDALDMLVTARNHDLKAARMRNAAPDDWLFALVSLQTQEGFLGAGNYGISRMNGGFASRPGVGILPKGGIGRRWQRDCDKLLGSRAHVAATYGLRASGGVSLVWTVPWDGTTSLAFESLDPFYIEVCRRVRLQLSEDGTHLFARTTGTKAARINAVGRNGITGDAWTPVNATEGKALTITRAGFDYRLASELVFGSRFVPPSAQELAPEDGTDGIAVIAQGITRGQGKTDGLHQRLVPISPRVRQALLQRQTDKLAAMASERVQAIGTMRSAILRTSLFVLFQAGASKLNFDATTTKQQVSPFLDRFERAEDTRFFDDLNAEVEADDAAAQRLAWLLGLADRAEQVLRDAFATGPQNGERRYKAQAAALTTFHGQLRSGNHLPTLADYYRSRFAPKETADVAARS